MDLGELKDVLISEILNYCMEIYYHTNDKNSFSAYFCNICIENESLKMDVKRIIGYILYQIDTNIVHPSIYNIPYESMNFFKNNIMYFLHTLKINKTKSRTRSNSNPNKNKPTNSIPILHIDNNDINISYSL